MYNGQGDANIVLEEDRMMLTLPEVLQTIRPPAHLNLTQRERAVAAMLHWNGGMGGTTGTFGEVWFPRMLGLLTPAGFGGLRQFTEIQRLG
ncbi:hypothetical protein LDENG_00105160 [Lucifuga dentata]|nr:hypothetical protein LDENG_00105160 [Lucifuga dentata]